LFGAEPERQDDEGDDRWDARVAVVGELRESTSGPTGAASTVLDPAEVEAASTLTAVAVDSPGVSQNGQGGHFQVFSVRGVSRQRVMNLVAGMRVNSERRAGASVSFIDPLLLGTVEVQRGPSTTFYGSGALGGVVQVLPRVNDGWSVQTGYDSSGDENYQLLGVGDGNWSVGVARRDADDAEAPDGTLLNSHFTQYSATLMHGWDHGKQRYEVLFIPTLAEEIGKANTDFPDRATEYPRERHEMLRFRVDSEEGWEGELWLHAHDLETEVVETGVSRNRVLNDSLDYGARWESLVDLDDTTLLRWGAQVSGRSGVEASETEASLAGPPATVTTRPLDDAHEIESGLFGALHWHWEGMDLEVGGRGSWQRQRNSGFASETQTAMNGFAGVSRQVGERLRLRGSVSSGLRFPSLSERFFTGTTGAGGIVGNPDLDSERSLNVEASARWLAGKTLVDAAVYRTEVDDYIERVETVADPDVLTFRNLTSGTLQGVELQLLFLPSQPWKIELGGHLVRGRDDEDRPLADVPPHRVHAGLRYRRGAWSFGTRWTHRGAKTDPGSAELRRSAADELRASVACRLGGGWSLTLSGDNLLDEEYIPAADRKAVFAPERSFGIRLSRTGS
jgi:iron complex outermembrane receptor protein